MPDNVITVADLAEPEPPTLQRWSPVSAPPHPLTKLSERLRQGGKALSQTAYTGADPDQVAEGSALLLETAGRLRELAVLESDCRDLTAAYEGAERRRRDAERGEVEARCKATTAGRTAAELGARLIEAERRVNVLADLLERLLGGRAVDEDTRAARAVIDDLRHDTPNPALAAGLAVTRLMMRPRPTEPDEALQALIDCCEALAPVHAAVDEVANAICDHVPSEVQAESEIDGWIMRIWDERADGLAALAQRCRHALELLPERV